MNRTIRFRWLLLAAAALVSTHQPARGQASPQRTITSAPANATPDVTDNIVRQYREMWQKMGPAQQKAFLDSGGSTPEQYERTLRAKGLSAAPPAAPPPGTTGRQSPTDPRTAVDALDSLTTSLQDLNAIRDGNLSRIQKDGCPPEVTSRLADLKGKLRQYEAELTGVEAPGPAVPQPKERSASTDTMAIANDWYKRSAKEREAPSEASGSNSHETKLLADVLPAAPVVATPDHRADPKSSDAAPNQKPSEDEIARLKAEIAQLSGACTTLKR